MPTETKTKIMLVDDEDVVTESLSMNLEQLGDYEVHAVNDPLKAIDEAHAFKPDLIVLDVVMPKMDGGDVQRAIRSDRKLEDTPIILVTALLSNQETGEGKREASGDFMLGKPVRIGVLVNLIEKVLDEKA